METEECRWCKGSGIFSTDNIPYPCTDCDGQGEVYICACCEGRFPISQMDEEKELCIECEITGEEGLNVSYEEEE